MCNSTVVETGSITLSASPSLTLQAPGSDSQTFCEGNSIAPIEYQLENGADNVQFQWTSLTILTLRKVFRCISYYWYAKRSGCNSEYTYQIIPVNSITGCEGVHMGSITVNALSSLVAITLEHNQSVCEGNPITPIEYSVEMEFLELT